MECPEIPRLPSKEEIEAKQVTHFKMILLSLGIYVSR